MKESMNILVIGNGFDLAHGLCTKYTDFLAYIQAYRNFVEGKSEQVADEKILDSLKDFNKSYPDFFTEFGNLIKENIWIEYFLSICSDRCRNGKEGWIDFEREISKVVQTLDSASHTLSEQGHRLNSSKAKMEREELDVLRPFLPRNSEFSETSYNIRFGPEAIDSMKCKMIDDLNRIIRCLEIYLCVFVTYSGIEHLADIENLSIDKILSFNYTETFMKLYGDLDKDKVEYDYIHGKADLHSDVCNCKLVLGIDEYLSGTDRDENNDFIQFKKFYQRIYKMTGCSYADWLLAREELIKRTPRSNSPELNIYFYGHSLDVTDRDIIRRLILATDAKTTVFYHDNKSLGNLIANLVKVIGEDELIKRTDGSKGSIVFKKTSQKKRM